MINASFHVLNLLDNRTMKDRSCQVSFGRLVCRWSMISCCRRRAFSKTSSDLERVRSRAVPCTVRPWSFGPGTKGTGQVRCHLTYDAKLHAAHAAQTRRQRQVDAGQLELFT